MKNVLSRARHRLTETHADRHAEVMPLTRSRTAAERREALERFNTGAGERSESTPEFEDRVALIAEKLAGTHHNIVR